MSITLKVKRQVEYRSKCWNWYIGRTEFRMDICVRD